MPLVTTEEYKAAKQKSGWRWEVFAALMKAGPGFRYVQECSSLSAGQQAAQQIAQWCAITGEFDLFYEKVVRRDTKDKRYAFWIEKATNDNQAGERLADAV